MEGASSRPEILRDLEGLAEHLNAHQVELIAQIERHLRAVHHTMLRIGTLRDARHRVGPELLNGDRRAALTGLADEIGAIEDQLELQEDTCREMHAIVMRMQEGASDLRLMAERLKLQADDASEEA
jgi:hypothetical protein